jgi:predicted nucleic acid-binding protein
MPAFVIDASAVLPLCFEDENPPMKPILRDRLRRGEEAAAPAHWPVEVLNGLLKASRRGRLPQATAVAFLAELGSFHILIEHAQSAAHWRHIYTLAARHNLTSYDAAYLELALRDRLPLATLDDQLRQAASREAVPLL